MKPPLARWLTLAALFAVLAGLAIDRTLPLLPANLSLTIALPAGIAGDSQPLLTTGITGAGDFLYVKYVDATTVIFGYDSWANGGPESAPVSIVVGRAYPLVIALPGLARLEPTPRRARLPLRLTLDGQELLNQEVYYRGRTQTEVWFGENPIGGTAAGQTFRGTLTTAEGRGLRGRPYALASWSARIRTWLTQQLGEVAVLALFSVALVFWLPPGLRRSSAFLRQARPDPVHSGQVRPPHGWFLATTLICTLAFVTLLTGGSFRLVFADVFGAFYDHQAASLLAGRLDVPERALSSESFLFHGKYYGYFGPTPALLRLPFVMAGIAFGQLSRSFLVFYYVGCLAAAYALLIHAARHLSRRATWPSSGATVLLVGSTGLGSTLFFTASRAYVYHEAILCGAMFALWSTWFTLRYLAAERDHRGWPAALVCGVLAVHARPPAGLFALGLLGLAAAVRFARAWPGFFMVKERPLREKSARPLGGATASRPAPTKSARQGQPRLCRGTAPTVQSSGWHSPLRDRLVPFLIGALAVLGVLSFNALSYLKFQSFEGAPLRYHVQYHPERLANIGGRNFHLGNLRFNFDSYVWRPSFVLRPSFPWFYIAGADPADYAGTRIDLSEQTLPVPYAMPALTLLALTAIGGAVFRWPGARLPLSMLGLATVPMALALFTAIAISHRYTADFVPPLLAAAAFGTAALPILPPSPRWTLLALTVALAVIALPITVATTLHYQGELVWGVPDEICGQYLSLRQQFDAFFGTRP